MDYKMKDSKSFQISIKEIEQLVEKNKYRQKIEERLSLIDKNIFSSLPNHGILHAKNTALFSLILSHYENISETDKNLLIDASLLHDIGRKNDFDDFEHGKNSAQIAYEIKKEDSFYDSNTLLFLCALIEGHCCEVYDNSMIEKYQIKDNLRYKKLLQILKDADILDRVRLSNNSLIEINRLNFEISKNLFLYVEKENAKKVFTTNPKQKERIISIVKDFLTQYRNEFTKEEILEIKRILFHLSKIDVYSLQALKEYENSLLKYFAKIWKKSLTNFDTYKGAEDFKFLVTCPTVRAKNFQMKSVISSSLMSNQHLGTFNKIPIGIVLELEEDSLLGISERDMHSLCVKKEETVAGYHYLNSTEVEKIYTKMPVMSLQTPKQIEMSLIQENIKKNGNILVLGEHSVYSDILLNGNKVKMKGILIIEPCSEEWEKEAQELADILHLAVKRISSEYYYNKIGLNHLETQPGRGGYSLYDLCFLESILKGTSNINDANNLNADNLFVQQVGKNFFIKSDESNDYLLYQPNEQVLHFVKKNDFTMIKIVFDGLSIFYFLDDQEVSKEEMASFLEDLKYRKSVLK